jgi:hypothetical protein
LDFPGKIATSFSNSYTEHNQSKIKRALERSKRFGKTGDYSNYGSEQGLGWKRWWTGRFAYCDHTGTTAVAMIGAGEPVRTVDLLIRSSPWWQPPTA